MQYYLDIVYLEGCPHSKAALDLLINKNIKHNLISVSYNNKDTYKTNLISTFPQLYLKKNNNNGSLLLGGNSDLQQIYNIIETNNNQPLIQDKLKQQNILITNKLSQRIYELFTHYNKSTNNEKNNKEQNNNEKNNKKQNNNKKNNNKKSNNNKITINKEQNNISNKKNLI
jgi:glutaredoxin